MQRRAGLRRGVGGGARALRVALHDVPVDRDEDARADVRGERDGVARVEVADEVARLTEVAAAVDGQQRDVDAHAVEAGEQLVPGDRVARVVDRDALELEHVADEAR